MSWYCRPTNWSQECVPANWMPLVPGLGCEIAIISLRCEMSELLDAEVGVQPTSKLCCKASGVAFGYRLQRQLQVALSPRLITTCSIVAAPSVVGRGVARRRSDVPTLRRLFAHDSQIIVSESSGAALWPKLCDLSQMVASPRPNRQVKSEDYPPPRASFHPTGNSIAYNVSSMQIVRGSG